jgi:hypothetical protein
MPSPFPGMDPYLETPLLWRDVHHGLISQIQAALNPKLRPNYVARVELRVYISDDDNNEIEEACVEMRHVESDSLVTVIEVLSPTNKIRGSRGRASFMEKRQEIIAGPVHWVEIDLLRKGEPSVTRPALVPSDYRVLISRAGERSRARYWPLSVRQPLPTFGIPLRGTDSDVALDLSAVFHDAYDRGAYDISIDYRKEPDPPLAAEDRSWADELLRTG